VYDLRTWRNVEWFLEELVGGVDDDGEGEEEVDDQEALGQRLHLQYTTHFFLHYPNVC